MRTKGMEEVGGQGNMWWDVYMMWWGRRNYWFNSRMGRINRLIVLLVYLCLKEGLCLDMNGQISNLPEKEQGELLNIGGDPDVEEPCMFERVIISMYFIVCVMLRIYQRICWRNRFQKSEIRTRMRRRISEWKIVGRSTGGMLLRIMSIRVRFVP